MILCQFLQTLYVHYVKVLGEIRNLSFGRNLTSLHNSLYYLVEKITFYRQRCVIVGDSVFIEIVSDLMGLDFLSLPAITS